MSSRAPPVDLARGDRLAGHRVTSILGWGKEGVAAEAHDEFLDLPHVLKAYPAEPEWVERLRFVAQAFFHLASLDLTPRPISGGVTATNRAVPVAYLLVERRIGTPLDEVLAKGRWTEPRAVRLFTQIAASLARVHLSGWAIGDFEGGNNIVLHNSQPLFIDIGLDDGEAVLRSYEDDFECLIGLADQLGNLAKSDELSQLSDALQARLKQRLDRRSLSVLLTRLGWISH